MERPKKPTNESSRLVGSGGEWCGGWRPKKPTNESSGLVGSGGEWHGKWRGQKSLPMSH